MKLGVCCSAEEAAWAKESGCEYIELNFTNVTDMDNQAFAAAKAAMEAAGMKSEAMNCFIPKRFPLMTLDDLGELEAYMYKGFGRAKEMGTEIVVFGSAGARVRPEGISKEEGIGVLAPIFALAGRVAKEHGMRIAIEPLSYTECNAVNTLRDGMALAKAANNEVELLADMYHVARNEEDFDDILLAADILIHTHIARPEGRKYPMPGDGYDYAPFFAALKKVGYQGRLSVEASAPNGPKDLPVTIGYLRQIIAGV